LNRKIKEYKLENKIIRPGHIETSELVAFYNLATVYIQPSLYEGFGLPLLQSFACGTPVISSNRGSLPEVGGKAALYFNPTDQSQALSLLGDVLQDRSLQYKLSKLGFEQVSKFSWEKTADQTIEAYKGSLEINA
ncbi:MAG: glycosyltransferase, partial [Candidatus Daviesbacteria bacterium]|nr:glycosyltransferase [Candidatus Daviesbacteria bacterium]